MMPLVADRETKIAFFDTVQITLFDHIWGLFQRGFLITLQ